MLGLPQGRKKWSKIWAVFRSESQGEEARLLVRTFWGTPVGVRWVCPNSTAGPLTPSGEENGPLCFPFPWGERY